MVNGVTESTNSYKDYSANTGSATKTAETVQSMQAAVSKNDINSVGAVYEPSSSNSDSASSKAKTYAPNQEMINKLKADSEAHVQQLQDIVNKLLTKQAGTYNTANGLKSIYEMLEVDPATKAQAQKDIAEDGYWGVEQTSSRIFDFAMALSGGDKDTMEKMKSAFLKAYDKAESAWGDKLPDICKNTYDAVIKKFDDYANSEENN